MKNVFEMRTKVAPALEAWRGDFWKILFGIKGDADYNVLAHLEEYAADLKTIIELAREIEQQ